MSIKCKLIGGFIGIAMLLLCVGLLGWGGVNSTASSLSQVVEYRLPAVQALMRIQYLVHSILGTQRALLNPGLGRETIEANYATLHKLAAELETVWNRYAEMPRSQEEEHFWSILQQTKKQRQDFNKQFIGLSSRLLDLDILDPVRFKKNLESYKSEFYKLVGNVGNMLQTEVEFAGGEDYRQSELGKWALKPGISNEVVRQALANVLAPLEKFYSAIAKAKGFIREGDIDAASFTYEAEITSAAEGIANQLSRLSTQADEAEALYDRMANLLMTQGRTLSRETFQAIDQLVVLNSEATEMEVARTVKNANIAGSLSLAGVGFGFVLAMLVGFGLTKNITRPLFAGIRFAQSVAKGDFTATLDVQRTDEAGVLADSLRTMVKTLKATIKQAEEKSIEAETEAEKAKGALEQAHFAKQESEKALYQGKVQAAGRLQGIVQEISVSTESLSEQIARMANGSEFQRSRSEKAVASVEQVNQMIQSVAHNAQHAADQSQTAGEQAKRGAAQVEEAIRSIVQVQSSILDLKQSMGNLAERTDDINSVLAMISDIADQTNLLALNAAIEAARAGEAGRGFAVVADEVRKLAEKTLEATRNVHDTVDGIQRFVLENVQATDKAAQDMIESTRLAQLSGKSMEEILQLVEDSFRQVHTIAQSCREQASLSEVTHQSVSEVYDVAVQTSKGVTICVASIDGLVNNSDKLRSLVDDLQKKEE